MTLTAERKKELTEQFGKTAEDTGSTEVQIAMLTERLQELEQEGIVDRTVIPESPIRVEYSLTAKGRALATAMDAVGDWAHKWGKPAANDPAHPKPRKKRA